MQVIRPGTKVSIPQAEIVNAMIAAVLIGPNELVRYQVIWWASADRKEVWMDAHEISADVPEWVPVGFVIPKGCGP